MSERADRQVFEPEKNPTADRTRWMYFSLCLLGLIVLSLNDPGKVFMYGNIAFLSAIALLLPVLMRARGLPRIRLDSDGVEYTNLTEVKQWRWAEVGPFGIAETKARVLSPKVYAAVAKSTGKTQDGEEESVLLLAGLPAGEDKATAQAFVDDLNRWRMQYGAAQSGAISALSASDLASFERRFGRGRRLFLTGAMAVIVLTGIVSVVIGVLAASGLLT